VHDCQRIEDFFLKAELTELLLCFTKWTNHISEAHRSAYGQSVSICIYTDMVEVPKVKLDAVVQSIEGGRKSMASASGQKRRGCICGISDLDKW
jgi:hypothetical protein